MPLFPYLHFTDSCAEAMQFYADTLGGTDLQMMPYSASEGAAPDWADSPRIMHAQLTIGDGTLMASDHPPGMTGDAHGGFSVMIGPANAEEAAKIYAGLAAGGAEIQPLVPTFFSSAFGMLRDRFGVAWIISAMPAEG